jgi:hypothetical protein
VGWPEEMGIGHKFVIYGLCFSLFLQIPVPSSAIELSDLTPRTQAFLGGWERDVARLDAALRGQDVENPYDVWQLLKQKIPQMEDGPKLAVLEAQESRLLEKIWEHTINGRCLGRAVVDALVEVLKRDTSYPKDNGYNWHGMGLGEELEQLGQQFTTAGKFDRQSIQEFFITRIIPYVQTFNFPGKLQEWAPEVAPEINPELVMSKAIERIVDVRLEINMGLRGIVPYKDQVTQLQSELERLTAVDTVYDELVETRQGMESAQKKLDRDNKQVTNRRADQIRLSGLEVRLEGDSFGLYHRGELVHQFNIPVVSAAIQNGFLLFLARDRHNYENGMDNLSVVDLDYFQAALGRTAVPVFNIPFEAHGLASAITLDGDGVQVAGRNFSSQVLSLYCRQQTIFFNVAVNLLDPKLFQSSAEMVAHFVDYWNRSSELASDGMESDLNSKLGPQTPSFDELEQKLRASLEFQQNAARPQAPEVKEDIDRVAKVIPEAVVGEELKAFQESWKKSAQYQAMLRKVGANLEAQKKLTARMRLLWNRLTFPRPLGAPTIMMSMGMVAGGLLKPWKEEQRQQLKTGALSLMRHPYAKVGAVVAAGAVLANFFFPEAYTAFVHRTLETVSQTAVYAWGKTGDIGYLLKESFNTTFEGFKPLTFFQRYFSDHRTVVGLTGITGLFAAVIFIPHCIINALKVAKEIKDPQMVISDQQLEIFLKEMPPPENVLWAMVAESVDPQGAIDAAVLDQRLREHYRDRVGDIPFGQRFTSHQNQTQRRYVREVADDLVGKDENNHLTAEDHVKVKYISDHGLEGLRDPNIRPGFFSRVIGAPLKKLKACLSNGKNGHEVNIDTLGQAVGHFVMSWATFTNTLKAFTSFWWDGYFVARSFVPFLTTSPREFIISPFKALTFLVFPNYYSVSMTGYTENSFTEPTFLNGGLRPVHASLARQVVKLGARAIAPLPERVREPLAHTAAFWTGLPAFVGSAEHIQLLERFEEAIIPIERQIQAAVLDQSVNALVQFSDNPEEILKLAEEGGIQSITDDNNLITGRSRAFFHTYYSRLMQNSMRLYLEGLAQDRNLITEETLTMSQLKDRLAAACQLLTLSESRANQLVTQAAASTEIADQARSVAEEHTQVLRRTAQNLEAAVLKGFDLTKNPHLQRVATVRRQMDKPAAMARAVRASVSALIIDKPIEVIMTLLALAAINDGILNPVNQEFMGPNSFMYMSRYIWMYGLLWGSISGLVAAPGIKLMQDVQHDDDFGEQPEGKYRKGSMLRYYWKHFNAPNNTLLSNQFHNWRIAWVNMKAALVNMTVLGLIFMGRLDWDVYIIGYLLTYFTLLDGFAYKIEQAYELAIGYYLKDIPRRLQANLSVQKMYQSVLGFKRNTFNFFYKLYKDITGGWIGNFESMSTPQFGPRTLSKILTGGSTFTQSTAEFLHGIAQKTAGLPLIPHIANACEQLITNNFTDWVPPRK